MGLYSQANVSSFTILRLMVSVMQVAGNIYSQRIVSCIGLVFVTILMCLCSHKYVVHKCFSLPNTVLWRLACTFMGASSAGRGFRRQDLIAAEREERTHSKVHSFSI